MNSIDLRKRFGLCVGAAVLVASSIFCAPGAAQADNGCGDWWPSSGNSSLRYDKAAHAVTVRVTFTFTDREITGLQCTRSSTLEVDGLAYGGLNRGTSSIQSNLPGAYLDTEASDSPQQRSLTVGSSQAARLVANQQYYTEITVKDYFMVIDKPYVEVWLNFQRGHQICSQSAAWCTFADQTQPMQGTLRVAPRVDLNAPSQVDSVDWGGYRRTEFGAGAQLGPGDKIFSPNGLNYLAMQSDGNLVEFIPPGSDGRPTEVWRRSAGSRDSIFRGQDDGNFVLIAPGNRPVWSTETSSRDSVIQLQDDRNLVVYGPGHVAAWSNNVAGGR